jgi:hypothetical protein
LCFAQINILANDNCYNAKQILEFELEIKNVAHKALALNIEANSKLMQLPLPKRDNQLKLSLKSTFPITFIVFYRNDTMIDDYVFRTDHRLPSTQVFEIPSDSSYKRKYDTYFIGNETRKRLKEKQDLYFECYIIYEENGIMRSAKTPKTKVLYG